MTGRVGEDRWFPRNRTQPGLPPAEAMGAQGAIHGSVDAEFEHDPVVEHLGACLEELERVRDRTRLAR